MDSCLINLSEPSQRSYIPRYGIDRYSGEAKSEQPNHLLRPTEFTRRVEASKSTAPKYGEASRPGEASKSSVSKSGQAFKSARRSINHLRPPDPAKHPKVIQSDHSGDHLPSGLPSASTPPSTAPVSSASTPPVLSASIAPFSIRDYQQLRATESTLRAYFDYLLSCFSAPGMNTLPTPVLPESITPPPASVGWSQFQAAEGEITYWRNRIRSLQQNLRHINIPYEGAPSLHSSPPPLPASPPAASPPPLSPTSNARPQLYSPPLPPSSPLASPRLCLSVSECREQLAASLFTGDRDTRSTTVTWFLKLVERVVELDTCYGVSQVDKLLNTVHSYIWKDPRYGKDRAYQWMSSWIGAKCAVTLGVSTYGPMMSWETFTKTFREEFDPEERECVRREYREQLGQDKERAQRQHMEQQRRTHFGQDQERDHVQREHREQQPKQEKLRQRRTHFNNNTEDKVEILEKRVVLLERHIMRVEQELRQRAFPSYGGSSNSSRRPEQGRLHDLESPAWRDDIHSCRICLVVFETGTQLHKHLRQTKHFSPVASASTATSRQSSPAASPAASRQPSPAPTPPALPSTAASQQLSTVLVSSRRMSVRGVTSQPAE
ncbi:hypothetical protein BDD12DRAFT_891451 [Trichophaea hybrida]|nr:hypothetical protein BDD12DRAFT_891451 [Trichophaea hybrida]